MISSLLLALLLQTTTSNSAFNPLLDSAETAIDKQEYAAAEPLVKQAVEQSPKDVRALYDLGFVEDALDHPDAAEHAYKDALTIDPHLVQVRLALGLLLALNGKPEDGRRELDAAANSEANDSIRARAFRALAQLDLKNDPAKARDDLLEALKLSPETSQDTLLTAQIAERQSDFETSEAAYRRILSQPATAKSDSVEAAAGLARLLIHRKNFAAAEPILRTALAADPQNSAIIAQLADVLAGEEKPQEAAKLLEPLHASQPENRAVTRILADLYNQSDDPADASTLYRQLLSSGDREPDLLISFANSLIRQKLYVEAESILEEAVQKKSDSADAWGSLAFVSSANHHFERTLEVIAMRSKYSPMTPPIYFLLATAYDSLHRYREAAEAYRNFLSTAGGKFPDQEWQARHRLVALNNMK